MPSLTSLINCEMLGCLRFPSSSASELWNFPGPWVCQVETHAALTRGSPGVTLSTLSFPIQSFVSAKPYSYAAS